MALKEIAISEAIKELGLPENAEFKGYVVHLPNEEEFLVEIEGTRDFVKRLFTVDPTMAKVYTDHRKATKDSKKCKQETMVCLLFDIGPHLVVVPMGD